MFLNNEVIGGIWVRFVRLAGDGEGFNNCPVELESNIKVGW